MATATGFTNGVANWPAKGPDENLDYDIDWTARLNGDTIANSAWTIPSGITQGVTNNTGTVATIWLSGGTVGVQYEILNIILTVGGREMEQTVYIKCAER